ncbi:MauE/DoxX family redox-associated membrane protein [Egicoccus sp. AB-alg6-2]|uniref:MauE/DoxX family redox-associated membrane protein n=1 Tax=Egicoccus sp. AB-alg6-2 TaxID=3242692 RepID=UPI00359DA013
MLAQLGGVAPVALDGVFVLVLLGAGLLVPAGIAKLRHPVEARDALGLRSAHSLLLVRAVGVGELILAGAVLGVGGRWPSAALAVAYLGFALVAYRQQRRGAACGCFGAASAPAGPTHVVSNTVVAVAAAATALPLGAGAPAPAWQLGLGPVPTALAVLLLVVAVATLQQLFTRLPALRAATRRVTLPAPRTSPTAAIDGGTG